MCCCHGEESWHTLYLWQWYCTQTLWGCRYPQTELRTVEAVLSHNDTSVRWWGTILLSTNRETNSTSQYSVSFRLDAYRKKLRASYQCGNNDTTVKAVCCSTYNSPSSLFAEALCVLPRPRLFFRQTLHLLSWPRLEQVGLQSFFSVSLVWVSFSILQKRCISCHGKGFRRTHGNHKRSSGSTRCSSCHGRGRKRWEVKWKLKPLSHSQFKAWILHLAFCMNVMPLHQQGRC